MIKGTRLQHEKSNEIMTFLRIEPIKYGLRLDHYIFRKNGKEFEYPKGEWDRMKLDWKVTNK
jgi:hypothetical protein